MELTAARSRSGYSIFRAPSSRGAGGRRRRTCVVDQDDDRTDVKSGICERSAGPSNFLQQRANEDLAGSFRVTDLRKPRLPLPLNHNPISQRVTFAARISPTKYYH